MEATTNPIDELLVEEAIVAYVEWHELSEAVQDAYEQWARATGEESLQAFCAYREALDREERSAVLYARCIRQILEPSRTGPGKTAARRLRPWRFSA